MRIILSESFLRSASKLPQPLKEKLKGLLELLKRDPRHPLLHGKKLTGSLKGLFSFRITRDWRAIYSVNSQIIYMLKVANRKDAYK